MKKLKIIFNPEFFENFEGTQEELDELVKEIEETFANGNFTKELSALDDIVQDMTDEEIDYLVHILDDKKPPTIH